MMKTIKLLVLFLMISICSFSQKTYIVAATDTLEIDALVLSLGIKSGTDNALIDTYSISVIGVTTIERGMLVTYIANVKNTGSAKVNINKLGAKPLVRPDGTQLITGDILKGDRCLIFYDGTNWILIKTIYDLFKEVTND